MTAATLFQQPPAGGPHRPPATGPAGQIETTVITTVKTAAAAAPRSLQVQVGPSELGTPCTRRLGYKMLAWPAVNTDTDPWASVIGTAVHAWLADAFTRENELIGRERYLVEQTVTLPAWDGPIKGHCDLYDRDTKTVADWKITGTDRLAKYRKNGPGDQYRTQAHLYGLGMQLAGEQPEHVAIAFLPRGGRIDGLFVWSEPYDHHVAIRALTRYRQVYRLLTSMDFEANPHRWPLLATGDAFCQYCPWFLPGSADPASGCPGHPTKK